MFCKYCGKELASNMQNFALGAENRLLPKRKQMLYIEKIQSMPSFEPTEKQDSLKFCKFCGEQISGAAKFCPKCGKNIIKKESPNAEQIKQTEIIVEKAPETVETPMSEPTATIEPEPIVQEQQEIQQEQKLPEQDSKNEGLAVSSQGKFNVKNLFAQVFKRHTSQERDEILKAGLAEHDSQNVKITPEALQPWLYSRLFLVLLAVFVIFEICLLGFYNMNMMPGVMLIGSIMVPFSLLTMYFELNIYRDISFYKTIGIFLLGGALSLLFTLFLYEIIPMTDEFNILGASIVSIIEEVGKVVIVILLLRRTKNITVLQGLLIGGAVGCGFAVFESAGYAFNTYLEAHDYNTRVGMLNDYLRWYYQFGYADSIGEMNFNIILRSILSFGGHTAWAAIEGAAYAKGKKISPDFIKAFAICFVLHAIWDTDTPATYFKLICLCTAAWWVIIKQIANFVEENKQTR